MTSGELARLLLTMRNRSGQSQPALADKLGRTANWVQRRETGRSHARIGEIYAWADACGYKVDLQFQQKATQAEYGPLTYAMGGVFTEEQTTSLQVIVDLAAELPEEGRAWAIAACRGVLTGIITEWELLSEEGERRPLGSGPSEWRSLKTLVRHLESGRIPLGDWDEKELSMRLERALVREIRSTLFKKKTDPPPVDES